MKRICQLQSDIYLFNALIHLDCEIYNYVGVTQNLNNAKKHTIMSRWLPSIPLLLS